MRQFLKFMLASMVGTFLIGMVLIMLFIGSLAALGSSFAMEGKPTTIKEGSILQLQLDQEIIDRGNKDQFLLDFGPFRNVNQIGLNTLLATLEHAKTDEKISAIFLDLSNIQAGFATMKEIREKLVAFKKESGKPLVAFSESYSQGSYYLATAADAIYLQPKGDLEYHGSTQRIHVLERDVREVGHRHPIHPWKQQQVQELRRNLHRGSHESREPGAGPHDLGRTLGTSTSRCRFCEPQHGQGPPEH
jgi:protease-4